MERNAVEVKTKRRYDASRRRAQAVRTQETILDTARRQFLEQNLHHTAGGTGILIFVCEAERYVEILVDHGISSRLHDDTWQALIDVFTQHVRNGQTLQGFLECIEGCGEVLADHVPVTQARNELPNRLVVLD